MYVYTCTSAFTANLIKAVCARSKVIMYMGSTAELLLVHEEPQSVTSGPNFMALLTAEFCAYGDDSPLTCKRRISVLLVSVECL